MKGRCILMIVATLGFLAPGASRARDDDAFITMRGLVALEPNPNGTGIKAHFVSPSSHKHPAALSVLVSQIHLGQDPAKIQPDRVIFLANGDAVFVWDFKSVELDMRNVLDQQYYEDPTDVDGPANAGNATLPRWAPTMHSIFDEDRKIKKRYKAPAKALFTVGHLEAVFDSTIHYTELWTIGERECTAVADGFRLGIDLVDYTGGYMLKVDTDGMRNQEIRLLAAANPVLSALPIHLSASMDHFVHFYGIRKKKSWSEEDPEAPSICNAATPGPSWDGSRCAPSKFP